MTTEEITDASASVRGRPVLLAVLSTSLFWVIVGGLTMVFWRKPEPVAFEIQPPPATSTPLPTPTPAPFAVDVGGAVLKPGVVLLTPGARVQDAITLAGGLASKADVNQLSLARAVQDGEKLVVPLISTATPTRLPNTAEEPTATNGSTPAPGGVSGVNVNSASLEELDTLPGIGPKTAQAIVDYRQANGRFASVEALLEVKGIGESTLARIRELIVIE